MVHGKPNTPTLILIQPHTPDRFEIGEMIEEEELGHSSRPLLCPSSLGFLSSPRKALPILDI